MIYGFLTVVVAIAVLAMTDLNPVRKLLARRRAAGSDSAATESDSETVETAGEDDMDTVMRSVERTIAPDTLDTVGKNSLEADQDGVDAIAGRDALRADADDGAHTFDQADAVRDELADETDEKDDAEDGFDIENLFDADVFPADRNGGNDQSLTAATEDGIVDLFASGLRVDWNTVPPLFEDYDPTEDQLVVVFDSALTPDPEITIAPMSGSADVVVLLNGQPVMRVRDAAGLSPEDIELIETDLAEHDAGTKTGLAASAQLETATAA